jgi:hypothetical protein
MAFEVTGTLYRLFPTEQKSGSFQAREFVLEVPDGNYPQYVKFQAVQDRCAALDQFNEGDQLKVSFDLRGREWQGKFFTNLNAWRIERATGESTGGGGKQNVHGNDENFPSNPFPEVKDSPANTSFDDLPF